MWWTGGRIPQPQHSPQQCAGVDEKGSHIAEYPASPQFPRRGSTLSSQRMVTLEEEEEDSKCEEPLDLGISIRKWPTAWWFQMLVLVVRTFRQSRHVITSKLNFLQTILMAVVVSLIWFQVPQDTSSINDRLGYVRECHSMD